MMTTIQCATADTPPPAGKPEPKPAVPTGNAKVDAANAALPDIPAALRRAAGQDKKPAKPPSAQSKEAKLRALRETAAAKPPAKKATSKAGKAAGAPAKPKAGKAAPAKKPTSAARKGSKLDMIADLLQRREGCTAAEVLKACKWTAVSMPQMARAAGLVLIKDKKPGQVTRYRAK